jgi:hypothetical protein
MVSADALAVLSPVRPSVRTHARTHAVYCRSDPPQVVPEYFARRIRDFSSGDSLKVKVLFLICWRSRAQMTTIHANEDMFGETQSSASGWYTSPFRL